MLPHHITRLGLAYHRHGEFPFGMTQPDRLHHTYLIGQTGTGKTTLLGNMVQQDIAAKRGFCLIDPHGDLAASLAQTNPKQVMHWVLGDPASLYGYNPLTYTAPHLRPLVAAGLIETLKKQWADSWGARMEHLLRYALLALLEQPAADISQIMPLFLDSDFRKSVIAQITDEQVRSFWTMEFPKMNYTTAIDGVAPIANKLGAFLADPVVRKAICSPEKPLRFRQLMDEGQCLIVDLGKGKLGASTANVLGGLIIANMMLAAFTRHDLPEHKRRPFFLYIDEFHTLSTTAFADLLPESRKFALALILSHQYVGQMDHAIHDAILGNVGTMMSFRVGARDAPLIARQLVDVPPSDLITLPNYRCFVQLMVAGQKSRTFSARTLPL